MLNELKDIINITDQKEVLGKLDSLLKKYEHKRNESRTERISKNNASPTLIEFNNMTLKVKKKVARIMAIVMCLQVLGFTNMFDRKGSKCNISALLKYMNDNSSALKPCWDVEKKPKDSTAAIRCLNDMMQDELGLRVKRKSKNDKNYIIEGWDLWKVMNDGVNIKVLPVLCADICNNRSAMAHSTAQSLS